LNFGGDSFCQFLSNVTFAGDRTVCNVRVGITVAIRSDEFCAPRLTICATWHTRPHARRRKSPICYVTLLFICGIGIASVMAGGYEHGAKQPAVTHYG